ncbi:MAG: hypothetical protein JRI68_09665 [Deltaproteobacteria bacterium]|nr:hypothetical protein [Deltaproteobacteria bacterium]
MVARWVGLLILAAGLAGCGDEQPASGEPEPGQAPAATASVGGPTADGLVLPPRQAVDTNPLGLPSRQVQVPEKQRVFAVPAAMLRQARVGSSLVLEAATVKGREGDDLVVRVGTGRAYPIHPAYVVVPRRGRMGRGTPVFAAYRGVMRHGVVKHLSLDRVVVRFTDLGFKLGDQKLVTERVGVLEPGTLMAGGRAAVLLDGVRAHVQLVSAGVHRDGKRRWLVLGARGEAQLVEEGALTPLPARRFKPKIGATVLAAWRGEMVPAKLVSLDRPGLYTVKRQRTSRRLLVGPGMIMAAAKPSRP